MKQICCIDCVHCYDQINYLFDQSMQVRYYCDAGTVLEAVYDPEKEHDCPNFVQFIEDI